MPFNKTGGFTGGDLPKPASSNDIVQESSSFLGGSAFQKSFSGGAVPLSQLQDLLPQGSGSSVMSPMASAITNVPATNPQSDEKK